MKKRLTSRRAFLKDGALLTGATFIPPSLVGLSRTAFAQAGSTFDYYISPTGSDSNPGTQASPWALTSLQDTNSNNARMAGKRIGMLAGIYPCSGLQSGSQPGSYQYPVLNLPQGQSGSPTVLQAVSGPGTVILDYSTSSSTNPLIGQNPTLAGYWTIDGLTIKGNNSTAQGFLVTGRYNAYSDTNSSSGTAFGITVQNCEIYNLYVTGPVGSNYGGMIMQGVQGAIIKNNYIHDITKPADQPHCHGYEEYGCLGSQIHYNTFANCPGGGIDLKAGVSGADVAYNYFYNCALASPTDGIGSVTGADGAEGSPNSPGTANVAHHNIFDSCGPVHAGDVNSTATQDLYYYNNTIYDTRSGSSVVADLRETAGNKSQFYNNILVTTENDGGGSYGTLALSSGNFSNVSNNCYFLHSSTGAWGQGTLYNSLSAWQASSASPDAHSVAANPVFISTITPGAGSAQFKLGSGSPCLGTGTGGVNIGAWDGTVTQIGYNPTGAGAGRDGGLGSMGDASVPHTDASSPSADASSGSDGTAPSPEAGNTGDAGNRGGAGNRGDTDSGNVAMRTSSEGDSGSSASGNSGGGCSVPTRSQGVWGSLLALGMVALARRRRTL